MAGYFPRLVAERPDVALCRAAAAVARAAEAAAQVNGLSVGAHLVLKMLAEVGPCSQRALAAELRIDRSVMVGIADELESLGCVRRERNPDDRRAYAVTITDGGRELLAKAEDGVSDYLDTTFAGLDRADRDRLGVLLGRLLERRCAPET